MEPKLKESTLLESLVNKLENASYKILTQTELIESKLNGSKCWSDCELAKAWPSGLINRLELALETLETSNKNLTHILDTLI